LGDKSAGRAYLVATDGSPASDKAVDHAIARAKEAGVPLIVAMAVEGDLMGARASGAGRKTDLASDTEKEARAKVNAGAERAAAAGVMASAEVVRFQPPDDAAMAIVNFAMARRVSAIFVGSHGRTGIVLQMLGSTADKIVKHGHCHVTVVR
jgi:nucleotide-binding universal stress UspA family protein